MKMNFNAPETIFVGDSEMAVLMRSLDWSQTPLGTVSSWDSSLKTAVSICLNSRFPMVIWWGKDLVLLYNDAWRPVLGTKHPKALGRPGQEVWAENWDIIGVQLHSVLETSQATWADDTLLLVNRHGYTEEAYFTYSYSPIFLATGEVGGAFTAVTETTRRVIGERRLSTLQELVAQTIEVKSVEETCLIVSATLANNAYDIPFALLYLVEQDGTQARLVQTVRVEAGTLASPAQVDLTQKQDCWNLARIKETGNAEIIDQVVSRFGGLSGGAWDEPTQLAIALPIAQANEKELLAGFLILGISPRREFDDEYRGFFDLVASNVFTAIANAQTYEAERRRTDALTKLDRAKTSFSNVSHKFRTPLTLMMSPLEELSNTLNVDDYLIKPFSAREALARVEATKEAEATYQNINRILDCMTDAFVMFDHNWCCTYANPAALRLLQKSSEELIGRNIWQDIWQELFPNKANEQAYQKLHRAVEEQASVSWEEFNVPVQRWLEIRAYPVGEGIALCFQDITDRKQTGQVLQQAHEALERRSIQLEQANTTLQNTLEELQVAEEELRQQNTELVIARELAELERCRYQDLFDFAPDGYVVTDIRGVIQEANLAIATLLTVERSYLINTPLAAYVSPSDRRALRNLLYELSHQPELQKLQTDELGLTFLKREVLPVSIPVSITVTAIRDGQMQFVGARWLIQDITERRQAKIALQQSEEQLRLATEGANLGMWYWDLATDTLTWTDRAKAMFGLPADTEMSMQVFLDAVHPDDRHLVQAIVSNLQTGQIQIESEHRTLWADGTVRWILAKGSSTYDADGTLISTRGVLIDITERKQAEAEREQLLIREQAARETAETANRIKDEFLAVLSHELRSPLNPILGWSKLLLNGKLDANRTKQALATIERNAQLQSELIEDLLDVSRILRGKLSLTVRSIDLASTIRAAIETVRLAAEAKSIQIKTTLDAEVGLVAGDSTRLQQVIWNLLSNAVKFTPQGGQVEVKLEVVASSQDVMPSSNLAPGSQPQVPLAFAQITITDTGKGIHPDFLPHVFDYFRQEDGAITRKFGGLGLGLAIVHHLVEMHGGTIVAESPGEDLGATFTVRLPLPSREKTREKGERTAHLTPAYLHHALMGLQVLVVDDDSDARDFVAFLLEQAGAKVITATCAKEALTALAHSKPDVLLSDIGMPEMDGYMLMQQVKTLLTEQKRKNPARGDADLIGIALTAYAGELDQKQAIAAGFQQHIAKPVEPDQLIKVIADLIQKSRISTTSSNLTSPNQNREPNIKEREDYE